MIDLATFTHTIREIFVERGTQMNFDPFMVAPKMKMQVATTVQTMVFCMLGGALSAQQTEPLIETFDGGWRAGSRSVDCEYREQSHLLDMTNGEARLKVDDEYQPPLHIRYSPGSILYIYGDEENGISGAAFDFVNNEMVARDFIPGQTKGNPYSDRIRCAVLE